MPATPQIRGIQMVQQRTNTETFKHRPSKEAVQVKEVANNLPPENYDRELLRRREPGETASNINKWLGSKICGKAC
jgi:hypothetical protein